MPAPKSIADKAIAGAKWTYLGTVARIAAQFVGQIALSRLLGPEPVGLFAYAFLSVSLITLVLEMGLGSALVQRKELTDEAIGIASSRLLLAATAGAVLQSVFATNIAEYIFLNPAAAPAIQAMAWTYPLNAIAVPLIATCRRNMAFKQLQKAQMLAYMIAYLAVGVVAALLGVGVWALILAWYANLLLQVVLLQVSLKMPVNYRNPMKSAGLEAFGLVVTATNVINWLSDNLAPFLVGRHFGSAPLGVYNTGNNLVRTPANHLVTSLQQVLFAAISRLQDNRTIAAQAYKLASSLVLAIGIPVFGYTAIASEQIVAILFGTEWEAAAKILPAISMAMIPHILMAIAGPILTARGKPATELAIQSVSVGITAALLLALTGTSLTSLVWGVFAGYLLRATLMSVAAIHTLGLSTRDLFSALYAPITTGTLFVAVAAAVLHASATMTGNPVVQIVASTTMATTICCVLIVLLPRTLLSAEVAWLIKKVAKHHTNPLLSRITAHSKKS